MQENKLPFKLEAYSVIANASSQYTIRFNDSRLHSIIVARGPNQSFKEVVRAAVLDKISRMTGPLNKH
jgi:hypothetical protein